VADVDCAARSAPADVVGDICAGALDPDRWESVLRETSRLVGGSAAAIVTQTTNGDVARIEARWNVSARLERALIWAAPFAPSVPAIWLLGIEKAFTTSSLFVGEKLQASLWHKLALQPEGLDDVAIVPLTKKGNSFSTLMIMRSAAAGTFRPNDAATIADHLRFKPLSRDWPNSNSVGIILTDALGKIVHTNAAAERLLDGCSLMCLEDDLAARDLKTDELLRAALANAAKVRFASPFAPPSLIIAKGPGTRELSICVARIEEDIRRSFMTRSPARVAVFVRSRDPNETATRRFIDRYPITIGESRLVALLAQGFPLEKAARALPLSPHIARERLAGILRRTGAYDEADLTDRLLGKARNRFDLVADHGHRYSEFNAAVG
jgi:hypothetical protein